LSNMKPRARLQTLIAFMVAVGLAVLPAGCAPKVQIETPMPSSLSIQAPSPDIPEIVAAFSGVWVGGWNTVKAGPSEYAWAGRHTLVVEGQVRRLLDNRVGDARGVE